MPFKSAAQKRLMEAAAHTQGGYGGVSQAVGKKFVAHDMSGPDWSKLGSLITKWLREEAAEPEHAEDTGDFDEGKHPRADNGQFGQGSGGSEGSSKGSSRLDEANKTLSKLLDHRPVPNSDKEDYVVLTYMGADYEKVNKRLRSGKGHTQKSKMIENWLNSASLPEGIVLYRGIYGKHAEQLKQSLKVGDEFTDKGFTSASVSQDAAEAFAEEGGEGTIQSPGFVFKINTKKGQKAAVMDDTASEMSDEDEGEVLIQCNSSFKVIDTDWDNGVVTVELVQDSRRAQDSSLPKRAAGILYVAPDGRVLLLKRAGIEGRDNYVGHWALPGGGVNADEQPIDGAAREAREEIGHDANVEKMRLIDRTTTPSGMEFHTFRHDVDAPFDPKLNDEHSAHMWASPEKLPEPMHPAVEKLLKSGVVNDAGTASDCIAMDRDSVRTKDEDGHLHVERAHISKACVNPYYGHEIPEADKLGLDPKKIYYLLRDPEELKKAASTFAGKPLLKGHTPAFAADHPADSVAGSVGHDIAFNHPYLDAPLTVWDGDAIDGIESDRQRELSSSYRYDADMTPGSFEGKKYDGVMRNIRGNHVALVETGRAGSDVLVGDEMPKSLTKQANDSKENIMNKHKPALSRHADYVRGALTVYLGPKLAKDAKIDLVSVLKGTTARNFKTVRPTVVLDIKKALNGKLARDASLDDVNLLLDKLEPSKEAMDEEELEEKMPMSPKDKAGEAEDDDMDNMSFDDDREAELREMLEGKHEPEEIERICAMMKPEAAKDEPPKFKEMPEVGGKPAKDDDEEKDKMKGMVSKPAMDAALKKNRDETIAEMRRQFADRTEAQSLVRPLIGEVTVAMDTAAKILTAALDHAGVEHDGITDLKALRRLTEVVVKNVGDSERAATRRPRIAADSADKITEFNKKHGITHSTMRHI